MGLDVGIFAPTNMLDEDEAEALLKGIRDGMRKFVEN